MNEVGIKKLKIAACYFFTLTTFFSNLSAQNTKTIESTIGYELFSIEKDIRNLDTSAEKLFRSALEAATRDALKISHNPKNRKEAIEVLRAIHFALSRFNFLQPLKKRDWTNTLGRALEPQNLSDKEINRLLQYNGERSKFVNRKLPIYYVDCDMGAIFFLSVGQRLGWDIRLVEIPDHNFLRWHLLNQEKVNWDWTSGESKADSIYRHRIPQTLDPRMEKYYLRSLEEHEVRGYYHGLIASESSEFFSEAEELFKSAVIAIPNHPTTLNNFAWFYATTPNLPIEKADLAIAYSLAAWSLESNNGNIADTVACSFAARGHFELGAKIEEYAIRFAESVEQRNGFVSNLSRIKNEGICK